MQPVAPGQGQAGLREEADVLPAAPPRWISYALIALGFAVLAIFAATTNPGQLGDAVRRVRPGVLAAAVACIVLQILVKAFRWQFMVRRLAGVRISMRFATLSIIAGVAAGSITPGRGIEVAKAMLLKGTHGIRLSLSTSAMIIERLLDLVMIVAALLLAALLLPRHMVLASGALLVMIAAVVGGSALVVSAPARVRGWGESALRALPVPAGVREKGGQFLDAFSTSILLWRQTHTFGALLALTAVVAALDLARVSLVFWAMGAALSVPFIAFTYVGAALLGMALLIPGGTGVTEVSQVGLIALLAPGVVPSVVARSAVLLDRFLSYYLLSLIGAGLLIAYHRYRGAFR